MDEQQFLGLWPYSPNGYVNPEDAQAMYGALINPYLVNQHWRNQLCFQDKGDESFGGSTYAYIPTNFQIISMVETMNRHAPNEGPYHEEPPAMNNLVQSIYQSVSDLWNNIRKATGTSQW